MRRLASIVLLGGLLAGCGSSPIAPEDVPIRLTIMPLPTLIGNPGAASFSSMLQNITTSQVNLLFPTSCQVLPHFIDRASGREVLPVGGGFVCATVLSQLSLQPSMGVAQVFLVKSGVVAEPNAIVLPPGNYAIYATLEDRDFKIRSAQLTFTLQ